MSFSKELKAELCSSFKPTFKRPCCKIALLRGFLMFTNSFERTKIKIITESEPAARLITRLVSEISGVSLNVYETEKKADGEIYMSYKLTLPVKADIDKLTEALGYSQCDELLSLDGLSFKCDKCRRAFLIGMFLAGGFINPPEKAYHLELTSPDYALAEEVKSFLESIDLSPKLTERKNSTLVYFKESTGIEDFLNYIGAQRAAFEIMNAKILKDLRNNANRAANCDTANIDKSVSAANRHISAIQYICIHELEDKLPAELQTTAMLRLENEQATLAELAELHTPPITKSGVNHRLNKIVDFARDNGATL